MGRQSTFDKLSARHSFLAPHMNRNPAKPQYLLLHASSIRMLSHPHPSRTANACSLFRSEDLFWGRRRWI